MKDRELLEKSLHDQLKVIQVSPVLIEDVKTKMYKEYEVSFGEIQKLINSTLDDLKSLDTNMLSVFTKTIYSVTNESKINPILFFNKRSMTESEEVVKEKNDNEDDEIKLPLTLQNVTQVSRDEYDLIMTIKDIKKLVENGLVNYNYRTQRSPDYIRKRGDVFVKPKLKPKSVKEIAEHLLNGTLFRTTITFNLRKGTANHDELKYNPTKRTLTINEGTIIDNIDGWHRINGVLRALSIDENIDFTFRVTIVNYLESKAGKYIKQIGKVNPLEKSHLDYLGKSRRSDEVVSGLMFDSDLKGLVSTTHKPREIAGQIVSSKTLSDAIEEMFGKELKTSADEIELFEYLKKFFNYLIALINIQSKEESLESYNIMFAGYIVIAKKLQNRSITDLKDVLKDIDFSKENSLWQEINVLDSNLNLMKRAKENLVKYFKEIDIKEG